MRIYLHCPVKGEEKTLRIKVPKSWTNVGFKVRGALEFFVQTYNAKNGTEVTIDGAFVSLLDADGAGGEARALHPDGNFADLIKDRADVKVCLGALPEGAAKTAYQLLAGPGGGDGVVGCGGVWGGVVRWG